MVSVTYACGQAIKVKVVDTNHWEYGDNFVHFTTKGGVPLLVVNKGALISIETVEKG
jgi:hypothetical protein